MNVQAPKTRSGKLYTLVGPDATPYRSQTPGRYGDTGPASSMGGWTARLRCVPSPHGGYVKHRVFFADEATAIAAGYRPCAVCLPAQHAAWKRSRNAE